MGKGRRPRPILPPPRWSSRLYLRLAPGSVSRLKFLLEGSDNLAFMTTLDAQASVVQLLFSPDAEAEVRRFLAEAREAVTFEVVEVGGGPAG